ncbi:MAG: formate dehydrogenase accessory protein FdhE [Acidobacteria bacterium]|nr:formate dehydrogenase accessory protein FdhE [Acidobacteriota bacterium]
MSTRSPGHRQAESPETSELRRLASAQPELAPAIDLQLGLVTLQRRLAPRIPLPTRVMADDRLTTLPADGTPLLRFSDLPVDWSDVRFALRETLDLLHRAEVIEPSDYRRLSALLRDGQTLPVVVGDWFEATRTHAARWPILDEAPTTDAALDHLLVTGLKPFLARCAEAIGPRLDLEQWQRGVCPMCGGEPEIGVLPADGRGRQVACGRCGLRWPFDLGRCHVCGNDDARHLVSFKSRDGHYRLDACERCRRYLKSVDERAAGRQVVPSVDTIATLPLDAAAVSRGYGGS